MLTVNQQIMIQIEITDQYKIPVVNIVVVIHISNGITLRRPCHIALVLVQVQVVSWLEILMLMAENYTVMKTSIDFCTFIYAFSGFGERKMLR